MSETKTRSPESITEVKSPLEKSFKIFYGVAGQVDEELEKHGQSIESVGKENYWGRVSEVANDLSRRGCSTPDKMALGAAIELTAATPYFILCQRKLDSANHPAFGNLTGKELDDMKYFASFYNSRLRLYALANPSVTAHELNSHLMKTIGASHLTRFPERLQSIIAREIRGAQHESGMGDLLRSLDGNVREATIQEDLQGIDYVYREKEYKSAFGIDIKASRTNVFIGSHGAGHNFALSRGTLMLCSPFDDEDFNGTFTPSPEAIVRYAPLIQDYITAAVATNQLATVEF